MQPTYNDLLIECEKTMISIRKEKMLELGDIIHNFKSEQDITNFLYPYFKKGYCGVALIRSFYLFYREKDIEFPHYCDELLQNINFRIESLSNGKYSLMFMHTTGEIILILKNQGDTKNLLVGRNQLMYHYSIADKEREYFLETIKNLKNMIIARTGSEEHINLISKLPKDILEKIVKEYI